jgi:nucleoside-diphosphate-sugar epimerase
VHLAGALRGEPEDLLASNATGTAHLLDAHRRYAPGARIIVVSSSAVYGYAGAAPIPEDAPRRPVSAYGESKVAQERVAFAAAHDGLAIAIVRPFNLAGPGQSPVFVAGRIVEEALAVERGEQKEIRLGSLAPRRDYVDVRDAVRAYWLLAAHPDFEFACAGRAFNVGSGRASAVGELVALCEEVRGCRYPLRLDDRPRVELIPSQTADTRAIASATGWQPRCTLRQTIEDMFAEAETGHAKRTGC